MSTENKTEAGLPEGCSGALAVAAALELGERLLHCGGEVSRVEDTIPRILHAYGAERVDVFTITSSIVVTAAWPQGEPVTQTRRVESQNYDLTRLKALNAYSRKVCAQPVPASEFREGLRRITALRTPPAWELMLSWALISGTLSIFYGGSLLDAAVSTCLGIILCALQLGLDRIHFNPYFATILCSVLGGFAANALARCGVPIYTAAVCIGNIMIFVPGAGITNALRDMFCGDTVSGLMRLAESIVLCLAIAWGFAVSDTGVFLSPATLPFVGLSMAFLSSLGFGLRFNARGADLWVGAGGGTLAWGVVLLTQALGFSYLGFFLGAVALTLWAEVFARLARCPVTVYLIVGIISMVPGGLLYRTMRFALAAQWGEAGSTGLTTLATAISIAAGIVSVTAIADAWKHSLLARLTRH